MPAINKKHFRTVLIHLLIWILYATFATAIYANMKNKFAVVVYEAIASYAICASIFYFNADFLLPKYFANKRYGYFIAGLVLTLLYNWFIRWWMAFYGMPFLTNRPPSIANIDPMDLFLINAWWWFQYIVYSSGYGFGKMLIQKGRTRRLAAAAIIEREKDQLLLQQQKLTLDNFLLRTRINPSFLIKTISSFHDKIATTHGEVGQGMLALSSIIRSSTQLPDDDDKISLTEEVKNIRHLISIYEMRYNNDVHIHFVQRGHTDRHRILPHLLITFVENAFKHGDLHDIKYPLVITLDIRENEIYFSTRNKKRTGPKEISTGFGLTYIRTQLENFYEDSHQFNTEEDDDVYSVYLTIYAKSANKIPFPLILTT
ncbi:histidine kinase [Chitinophaga pendula]|uniref:histidine kinase n=1 Tax=Chitinophaga TaxID=79328 RepID=UPI000BAFF255|nr:MULTISPECIES: histidine kinase [Chitinophaga]ASZ14658.1 hypothetical protein CK934_28750 [Chitinophaga sp. MD30]UCJ07690.1 histidine kinase [Chitinophaga pendula]